MLWNTRSNGLSLCNCAREQSVCLNLYFPNKGQTYRSAQTKTENDWLRIQCDDLRLHWNEHRTIKILTECCGHLMGQTHGSAPTKTENDWLRIQCDDLRLHWNEHRTLKILTEHFYYYFGVGSHEAFFFGQSPACYCWSAISMRQYQFLFFYFISAIIIIYLKLK